MAKEVVSPQLEEYKFVYELEGSLDLSTKYFMANHIEDAIKMFSFVCEKNDLNPVIHNIEKWNRWSSKWEMQNESATRD